MKNAIFQHNDQHPFEEIYINTFAQKLINSTRKLNIKIIYF